METTGVRQGMGIMHSDVMDTVFLSGDAWDSIPLIFLKLGAEVSAVLGSEWTNFKIKSYVKYLGLSGNSSLTLSIYLKSGL